MMDFTYADMKFRSHFNDDEEEEYVSQSFTRFRIKALPVMDINKLKDLLSAKVTVSEIARKLCVSRQTIYTYIQNEQIDYSSHTSITDEQLKDTITKIKTQHPESGEVILIGHLRSQGIHVQRSRVRAVIHEIDPEGVEARKAPTIHRRSYYAPCPHYVWHIDGNHKLIKWKLVIHAAVDGYTRLITFLKVSDNNMAATVLQQFQLAITAFEQRPLRIRTDLGGENTKIWQDMINTNGPQSVMVGSSVHNERVERMWRDVTEKVSGRYISVFSQMAGEDLLDEDNNVDIMCLHYAFKGLIQKDLSEFAAAHNYHGISTEGGLSPLQLLTLNSELIELHKEDYSVQDAEGARQTNNSHLPHVQCATDVFSDELRTELKVLRKPSNIEEAQRLYSEVVGVVGHFIQRTGHV